MRFKQRIIKRLAWWLLALIVAAGFASLGRWQLARMHEKQAMLDGASHVLDRSIAQPLLLASDVTRVKLYDWAQGQGQVDHRTLWLDNQRRAEHIGVRMYCLLFPDVGGQAILVDAGWWPMHGRRELPELGCPVATQQQVRGLLAAPPSEGLAHGEAVVALADGRWLATRMDMQAIAQIFGLPAHGLAPRVLRLDPVHANGDAGIMLAPGERDLDILPNTMQPERHLGYAVQWFGLALTVLIVALVMTLRAKKHDRT